MLADKLIINNLIFQSPFLLYREGRIYWDTTLSR